MQHLNAKLVLVILKSIKDSYPTTPKITATH
jgi:hypothetical protein